MKPSCYACRRRCCWREAQRGETCGEGEALLKESLTIARQQRAHLFTLRTSLTFARLRIAQRRPTEAAGLLRRACTEIGDQSGLADFDEALKLLAQCDS